MTEISPPPPSLLQPGRSCWRVEAAQRVAFVVDADAYFRMAKAALRRARHSILVLGWDYHPRVRLEPGGPRRARRTSCAISSRSWSEPAPISRSAC